jgi:hypothetical protein
MGGHKGLLTYILTMWFALIKIKIQPGVVAQA